MAFLPSKPTGLVSRSLKFLFSSPLLSEATVSAPSNMLAHVHLLDLASSRPQSPSLSYLPAAEHKALSMIQKDTFSLFSLGVFLPLCHPFLPSSFCASKCELSPFAPFCFCFFFIISFCSPSSPCCLLLFAPLSSVKLQLSFLYSQMCLGSICHQLCHQRMHTRRLYKTSAFLKNILSSML